MIAAIVYSILITGGLAWAGMPVDEAAGWALFVCFGLLFLSAVCKPVKIVVRYLRLTLKALWRTARASGRLFMRVIRPSKATARRRATATRTRTQPANSKSTHGPQPAAPPVLIQVVNNYYGPEARDVQRPTIDPEQFGLPRFGEQQLQHWNIFPPTVDAS
ncbi:hypothetical protein [Mycobacteroides abscessus]|uniref:hypothetical protein n=1 Tax=Mycobacteroides abscessus TaxID=36809 RepID=UPI002104A9C0|nr:hypothetical protein [Mycobacteroides abscessus]